MRILQTDCALWPFWTLRLRTVAAPILETTSLFHRTCCQCRWRRDMCLGWRCCRIFPALFSKPCPAELRLAASTTLCFMHVFRHFRTAVELWGHAAAWAPALTSIVHLSHLTTYCKGRQMLESDEEELNDERTILIYWPKRRNHAVPSSVLRHELEFLVQHTLRNVAGLLLADCGSFWAWGEWPDTGIWCLASSKDNPCMAVEEAFTSQMNTHTA